MEETLKIISKEDSDKRCNEISEELFNKPFKDIKYLYVTNYIHPQLLQEELTRTGLYQWINVFKGEVKYPKEVKDYNDYDIVQVNMSAQDVHLIGNINEALGKNSKTKLVVNNDYTTEAWGTSFDYPTTIGREVRNADMIFGTEYFQVTAVAELTGREVYIIPHPSDIKRLKSLTPIPKNDVVTVIWRRYDANVYIPHLMSRNHGVPTNLIGYDQKLDRKAWLTSTLYDYIFPGTNFFEFSEQMRSSKVILDPFTFHSYSRSTVETAALKTAVVVSNRTQSGNLLYPHTLIDPWDVKKARELISKLFTDEKFYDKVIETAYKNCEFYNHENSRHKYLTALYEECKKNEKKV